MSGEMGIGVGFESKDEPDKLTITYGNPITGEKESAVEWAKRLPLPVENTFIARIIIEQLEQSKKVIDGLREQMEGLTTP